MAADFQRILCNGVTAKAVPTGGKIRLTRSLTPSELAKCSFDTVADPQARDAASLALDDKVIAFFARGLTVHEIRGFLAWQPMASEVACEKSTALSQMPRFSRRTNGLA